MDRIVLKVKSATAQQWQQASARLKEQASQMVERLLARPEQADMAEENRKIRVQKAREFFSKLSADFTDYKFDRNEANER